MKPFLLLSTRRHDEAAHSEYAAVAAAAGLAPADLLQIRVDQAPLGPLNLDDYSGFILGGSDFCASTADKSALQLRVEADLGRVVDEAVARDRPFFGLCYGVGLLTARLGGLVDAAYWEPIAAIAVTLTAAGRADPLLAGVPDRFHAFVGHKEAASRLPDGAVLLATGERCPVQLFRLGANVYASQFHPELDAAGLIERMRIYKHHGYFDPADFDRLAAEARSTPVDASAGRLLRDFVQLHAVT